MQRITFPDGAPRRAARLRRGSPDVLQALARAASATHAPSGFLLGAFVEAAADDGRSLSRLARQAGASRQAVARWRDGGDVRPRRARARLAGYAARLAAQAPAAAPEAPPVGPARQTTRVDALTLRLAEALGWGQAPAFLPDGSLSAPELMAGAWDRSGPQVLEAASALSGLSVDELSSRGKGSAERATWRCAVARVLEAMGWTATASARLLGIDHSAVIYHLRGKGAR